MASYKKEGTFEKKSGIYLKKKENKGMFKQVPVISLS